MIAGIDIGTSFSSICILNKEGKAEPVKVSTGLAMYGSDYSLPSAVFISNGQVQVGQAAFNLRMKAPENFKNEFKRDFGQEVPYHLGGRQWLPEDLYKELFIHLKYCAETYASEAIDMAYITHPARFTDRQKKLLQQAAQKAGLLNTTFLAEPVAAAFHYVSENNLADNTTLLVYDFGGGTFDVALVRYLHGEFELIAQPHGIDRCGGIDVDRAVFSHIMAAVPGELHQSVKENPKMLQNFKAAINEQSIKTKHHLSSNDQFHGEFPVGFDFVEFSLNRPSFNSMISHLVDETIQCVNNLLKNASFDAGKVDEVLLVGGSSRIPLVKTALEKAFKRPIKENVIPELAIALGAAGYGKNNLSCGFVAVKDRTGRYGFNDTSEKNVLPNIYEEAQNFSENRAAVKMNGKWGVIDQTGRIITPFAYDELYPYKQGLAKARKNDKWGFLNRTGAEQVAVKYSWLGDFANELCPAKTGNLYGYIAPDGRERIPLIYSKVDNYINGRARVTCNGKTGYINTEGKEYIPCFFDEIGEFIDGLALVKIDKRYGFINDGGKAATRFIYQAATLFSKGFSIVSIDNKQGAIDRNDNILVPIRYRKVSYDTSNMHFVVEEKGQQGIYSLSGESIKGIEMKAQHYSQLVDLVFVEGGNFEKVNNQSSENKSVQSYSVRDFQISPLVTQELWHKVIVNYQKEFDGKKDLIKTISRLDAQKFCNNLSKMEGLEEVYEISSDDKIFDRFWVFGYRLPHLKELEFINSKNTEFKELRISKLDSDEIAEWYSDGDGLFSALNSVVGGGFALNHFNPYIQNQLLWKLGSFRNFRVVLNSSK